MFVRVLRVPRPVRSHFSGHLPGPAEAGRLLPPEHTGRARMVVGRPMAKAAGEEPGFAGLLAQGYGSGLTGLVKAAQAAWGRP